MSLRGAGDPDGRSTESTARSVAALSNDARLSNKELAAQSRSRALLGTRALPPPDCATVACAASTPTWIPAPSDLAIEAMISVHLKQHTREASSSSFADYLQTLPEVVAAYHVAGGTDFLVHVRARATDHLRDFAIDAFTTRAEVGRLETALVFEHLRGGAPIWPQ